MKNNSVIKTDEEATDEELQSVANFGGVLLIFMILQCLLLLVYGWMYFLI